MRKTLSTIIILIAIVTTATSQNVFKKNDIALNAGIGFGSHVIMSNYSTLLPPISISGEYCIMDNLVEEGNGSLGIGAYFATASSSFKLFDIKYKANSFVYGARGTFHYQLFEKVDTYTGVLLGIHSQNGYLKGIHGSTNNSNYPLWSLFVGAKYYITPNFGGMVEVGYGTSSLMLGVTYKI